MTVSQSPSASSCGSARELPTLLIALRYPPVPIRLALVRMRGREEPFLREMRADDLQADRQPAGEAAGNRQRREAGKIRADRVDIVEVHGHGIRSLGAELEGGRRRRRPHDHIDLLECPLEVARDELADLLRLQIV